MRKATHFPKDSRNIQLSIRDTTITSCQKESYLHIKRPIIKLTKEDLKEIYRISSNFSKDLILAL